MGRKNASELSMGVRYRYQVGGVGIGVRVFDFLKCNPKKNPFRDAEVLLVDPSCSGSGLPEHRIDNKADEGEESENMKEHRLNKLASFQRMILSHALKFPKARTIMYSTCSMDRKENEDVVDYVLNRTNIPGWTVTDVCPAWREAHAEKVREKEKQKKLSLEEAGPKAEDRRIVAPLPELAGKCINSTPDIHDCRGFFLCRLDRKVPEADTAITEVSRKRRKVLPSAERKRRRAEKAKAKAQENPDADKSTKATEEKTEDARASKEPAVDTTTSQSKKKKQKKVAKVGVKFDFKAPSKKSKA